VSTTTQSWKVGEVVITSVVEDQIDGLPPGLLFPDASTQLVQQHRWLAPDYADESGTISLRVQALVIDQPGRRILVDPCVGNGKTRWLPNWNQQDFPFLQRFADAGFSPESVDVVVHTHLHADHVGWDTRLVDGTWVPTFPVARHLFSRTEMAWFEASPDPDRPRIWEDSLAPIFAAGLADLVDDDHDLGGGVRSEPTPGHTGGHVSLWITSGEETALITGDFMHHPLQFSEPDQREVADDDIALARQTRRSMIGRVADTRALVVGTHFPNRPAGHVVTEGGAWRFMPV
jgi:glyoxylase-like metal-dependent hydrolase (beta-lactamase superfamily II)